MRSGIYRAECAKFMEKMGEGTVDLTVTSPPYDNLRDYQGYSFDFGAISEGLYRVTAKGGVVVWVVGDKIDGGRSLTSFRQAVRFQEAGFVMHDVMIYQKKNTPFTRSNAYTNCYEMMFILSKGSPKAFNPMMEGTARPRTEVPASNKKAGGANRKVPDHSSKGEIRTSIWKYAVGLHGTASDRYAFAHPAMFPEKLAKDHILTWSNLDDLVFDPMCGAGTTPKMAKLHGRRYVGVDVSSAYVKIAKKRVSTVQTAIC